MANRSKIPPVSDAAGGKSVRTERDDPIPERPPWLKSAAARSSSGRRRTSSALSPAEGLRVSEEDRWRKNLGPTFASRAVDWLKTAVVTGYGLSLLLHALLLLVMAFWFFPQIAESTSITTVVESDQEAPQPLDAMDDVSLQVPAGSEEIVVPQLTDVIEQESELNVLEHQFLQDVTAADTQGEGGATDAGDGGFRLLEPKNAVKAGSFTAWTIPIAQRVGEQPQAGDSPRPGQDYHIVIQVKIPEKRNAYNISDLTGKVIGTDGYIQPIPAMAFTQDDQGRMRRAQLGRHLPIIDGVVQILIRVPGAESLVKDTIRIKSKLLKENQTLELVFGKSSLKD